jgi:hypothetical protein
MPSYTLGEIMSFATGNVGRRADIDGSVVSRMANEAYFDVYYASSPAEGEQIVPSSTTSGENKIELPTDFHAPISLALIYQTSGSPTSSDHSSHKTLTVRDVDWMDARNPQPSGTPTDVAFYNSWLELYPSPNSAFSLQLRYRAGPSDMTALTALPSVDTAWRSAIVIRTEELLYHYLQDDTRAQAANLRYLQKMITLETKQAKLQQSLFRQHATPIYGTGGRRRV